MAEMNERMAKLRKDAEHFNHGSYATAPTFTPRDMLAALDALDREARECERLATRVLPLVNRCESAEAEMQRLRTAIASLVDGRHPWQGILAADLRPLLVPSEVCACGSTSCRGERRKAHEVDEARGEL